MPHTALNRVIVRMLFDPIFVETLYLDPYPTLSALKIPEDLILELVKTDKRAWGVDTERRKRTLHALIGEFKCTTALALSESQSIGLLDAFFSHPLFHDSIQNRGSLTEAFIEYLNHLYINNDVTHPHFPDILTLEATKARNRRAHKNQPTSPASAVFYRCPGVSSKALNGNVIVALNKIEQYLYDLNLLPILALCEDRPPFPTLPSVSEPTHFLFRPRDEDIHLSPISIVIHDALRILKSPLTRDSFLKQMKEKGLSTNQGGNLLDALLGEGLLKSSHH